MTETEFDIIAHYFQGRQAQPAALSIGIGDDAAVLSLPQKEQLVVTMDTLNSGVHFPEDTPAADIAWKALAVNLSDLAAMGAVPRYFTLSLCLPRSDPDWLRAFADALFACADAYNVCLVGGDTTRGPLSISLCAFGGVAQGAACTRGGARAGDRVYVTGTLGDAALGLQIAFARRQARQDHVDYLLQRLRRPTPRLAIGQGALAYASAMIDISDGLAADLGHILTASGYGADIFAAQLPLSESARAAAGLEELQMLALTGGDDYELCITVPPAKVDAWECHVQQQAWPVRAIGMLTEGPGLRVMRPDGSELDVNHGGYDHFPANNPGDAE